MMPADRRNEPDAEAILDFWFRDPQSGRRDLPLTKRWFQQGQSLDAPVIAQFGDWIEPASQGARDHWQDTAAGSLALMLLLDQFPRHVWRRQAQAFAFGEAALARCRSGLAAGHDQALPLVQRVFYYLPLEHSESLEDQRDSVTLFTRLRDTAPPELAEFAHRTWESAIEHQAIIEQFGRYPHRNAVLGRESTAAEADWLQASGKNFGQ